MNNVEYCRLPVNIRRTPLFASSVRKAPFIATQLNSTQLNSTASCRSADDASAILNVLTQLK